MDNRKAVVVGISGCSSSGKTTIARLLRDVFPRTFVLHGDDFYKAEAELPVRDGLVDWDCPEAITIPTMERALGHVRETGTYPPELDSKEDQNTVGKCPVSEEKVAAMKEKVTQWIQPGQPGYEVFGGDSLHICLLDGFLLYCKEMEKMQSLIDIKLFLLVSREKATQRRESRDGYVTLEGFWQDPPGYVDKIVWPNYVSAHAWMFVGGDVEGQLDEKVMARAGIRAQTDKGLDVDMETTFEWAVDSIMDGLMRIACENQ